jgi:eukaryotic-like serine/threonine-protein kinase
MMTPERWARIKEVFAAVMDQPPADRLSALADLCGDDHELEAEVKRLLAQHEEMGGFLESTPSGAGPADFLLAKGEVLAGRYRVLELLGTGGMGEVYEVEDRELGERIALKVIRQETPFDSGVLDRLRREVQLARRVTHPNVCRVFDLGHHEQQGRDYIFLTMELIKGETLSSRLKRKGKITPSDALVIAVQLCQALDAAHQAGILHRDFKTGNVMLRGSATSADAAAGATNSGAQIRAVVTDFGIARLMRPVNEPPGAGTTGTVTHGLIVGTPAYMSPEQLLGEKLTPASDIYSLGLVLYEMVTGTRPFQGDSSWTETLKRLTIAPLAPIKIVPELGENWNATLLRCLERDPQKRFQSTLEVAECLTGRRQVSPSVSRRALIAAACSILLLAALGFAFHDKFWPTALPAQKHLAILPFTSAGTEPANQAAAYELSESLTDNLSRLQASDRSLWVVPWLEVRNQKPQDAGHAGSALGANLVLVGELHRDSGGVGLRLELKDAGSLKRLGSRTIDVPAAEVLTVEDKLLQSVAELLQIHIPEAMLHHLPVDETAEPGAYEFYQQGRGFLAHAGPGTPEDLDRAITLLQKAVDKDPNFALAFANLAYAYSMKFHGTHDLQWLNKAKQTCDGALSLNDKLPYAHLALGAIDEETGDEDAAIKEFETALRLDPTNDNVLRRLSLAYDRSGRLLQAESLLKEAVKSGPGNFMNYNNLGVFYYQHAQYVQAEQPLRTATDLAPDNPLAFYNLSGVYLAEGKFKEAETILTRAIAIKPSAGAYSNLGTIRQYQGRYEDAALMFQKATQIFPSDHRLWCNLGNAYELARNKAKADEAYEKAAQLAQQAVTLRPNDGSLLGWLALYYAKLGQRTSAQKELAQALSLSQNDPQLLFNSALIYELVGDREHALSALHSALRAGYSVSEAQSAPELAQLRKDPRFSKIVGSPGP